MGRPKQRGPLPAGLRTSSLTLFLPLWSVSARTVKAPLRAPRKLPVHQAQIPPPAPLLLASDISHPAPPPAPRFLRIGASPGSHALVCVHTSQGARCSVPTTPRTGTQSRSRDLVLEPGKGAFCPPVGPRAGDSKCHTCAEEVAPMLAVIYTNLKEAPNGDHVLFL